MTEQHENKPELGTLISVQAIVLGIALVGMDITGTAARNEIRPLTAIAMGTGAGTLSYALLFMADKLPFPGRQALRDGVRTMLSVLGELSYVKIILISAGAAISEECLFRLFLQGWLSDIASPGVGILVGAILFGLLHAVSVAYVIGTVLMGLVLGAAYGWTGSAVMVIVWHFIYDVLALVIATRKPEWVGLERAKGP